MQTSRMGIGACVLLLTVGAAMAQKVSTDFDHKADFSNYKTYAWIESKNPARNPLWNQRIIEDIERQMAAKGLRKVEGQPDVYVTYNGGLRENTSLQGFGPGPLRLGGGSFSVNKVTSLQGTLIVDLYDAQAKQLVWRGMATETISDKTEKNIEKLQKVVEKLFKEYPPKPKK